MVGSINSLSTNNSLKKLSSILIVSLVLTHSLFAQLNSWVGPASGNWGVAGNWSQGTLPDAADSVVISNATVTISSGNHQISNIFMGVSPSTSLLIENTVTLEITNTSSLGNISIFYNLTNNGLIQVLANPNHNGTTFSAGGLSENNATINMTNGGGSLFSSHFTNNGIINIIDMTPILKSALENLGKFTNNGFITIDGCNGTSADGLTNKDTLINNPTGQITITNVDGLQAHGLQNEKFSDGMTTNSPYIHNQGEILISDITGANANGIFSQHNILNDSLIDISDITDGENLSLASNGSEIINNGEIRIANAMGYSGTGVHLAVNTFFSNGPKAVLKLIDIADAPGGIALGLRASGSFLNQGEILVVDQSERFGIINSGRFINENLISFTNPVGNSAIQNSGYFEISPTGIVLSTNSSGIRILENLDTLINKGCIDISLFTSTEAIRNSGYFQNDSLIAIYNQTAVFSVCLSNQPTGEFINNDSGVLNFQNITAASCVSNQGDFINYGTLNAEDITSSAAIIFVTANQLVNHGLIDINRANGTALEMVNSNFINEVTGVISIDSISKADFNIPRGLQFTNMNASNAGTISITNHQDGQAIFTSGTGSFINQNELLVKDITYFTDAVAIGALMINEGRFRVTNVSNDAIFVTDSLINADSLIIKNTNGPGLENRNVLLNYATGVIKITNTEGTLANGLINAERDIMTNEGVIIIDSVGWNGIENRGTFTNKTGGFIEISNILTNNFDALENDSTFVNESCASLILHGKLENRTSFNNDGYIYQNHPNNFFISGSTFNHQGVYVDVQGASESLTGFQNDGIYIKEIPGSFNCVDTIFNFYSGTNINNISAAVITKDEAGTQVAGSVDLDLIEIRLGLGSAGATELFIPFDYGGSCAVSARIPFTNAISCSNFMVWTGAISSNWSNPGNWSLNRLPNLSDEISIPTSSMVEILLGFAAEAKLIDIAEGAILTVDGVLNVAAEMP